MKNALLIVLAVVGVVALVVAVTFGVGWLQLPWQNINTQVVRNSNQFVTSIVTELQDKQLQWESIDVEITKTKDADTLAGLKSQQNALVRAMKEKAQLIDAKFIPTEVSAFIATHEVTQ